MMIGPAKRITHDSAFCMKKNLCWTPGGEKIVFAREVGIEYCIYSINPDGTGLKQISESTPDKSPKYEPDCSPDGTRIVYLFYTYAGTDGFLNIQTMDMDGKNVKRIVPTPPQFNMHPAWSPDGKTIAFVSTRAGNPEIHLCDPDGNNVRRITNDPAMDEHPTWSPDSKQIAFNSNRDGNWEIYSMDADGKHVRRLTNHPSSDTYPKWSPDGKHIAFMTFREGNDEIYVMDADGKNPANLSNHPSWDRFPAWRPDGKALAWVSYRENMPEIYVAELVY